MENPVQPRSLLGLRAPPDAPGGLLCLARLDDEQLESSLKLIAQHSLSKPQRSDEQIRQEVRVCGGQPSLLQLDLPESNLAVVSSTILGSRGDIVGVIGYCYPMLQQDSTDLACLRQGCSDAAKRCRNLSWPEGSLCPGRRASNRTDRPGPGYA